MLSIIGYNNKLQNNIFQCSVLSALNGLQFYRKCFPEHAFPALPVERIHIYTF